MKSEGVLLQYNHQSFPNDVFNDCNTALIVIIFFMTYLICCDNLVTSQPVT